MARLEFKTGGVNPVSAELAHEVEQGQLLLASVGRLQLVQGCQIENRRFLEKRNFNFQQRSNRIKRKSN